MTDFDNITQACFTFQEREVMRVSGLLLPLSQWLVEYEYVRRNDDDDEWVGDQSIVV